MASNTDALKQFFLRTIDGLIKDAAAKNQKIPVSSMRFEADELHGSMYAADYFQYLVTGRGPGKFPPPDKMTAFVEANPDILARARQVFKYLTAQQLGYLIGRKIATQGTDIYQGKKPGIDLLGVMDENMPLLLEQLGKNEAVKIATDLKQLIKNEQFHPANS
jgi:hypothetical protein